MFGTRVRRLAGYLTWPTTRSRKLQLPSDALFPERREANSNSRQFAGPSSGVLQHSRPSEHYGGVQIGTDLAHASAGLSGGTHTADMGPAYPFGGTAPPAMQTSFERFGDHKKPNFQKLVNYLCRIGSPR
jgi:hypothetical protein